MNLRSPLLASALVASGLLTGCTEYSNRQTCLDQVHASYNDVGELPLKISNVSLAAQGSRVVVEGTIVAPKAHKTLLAAVGSVLTPAAKTASASSGASAVPAAARAASAPAGEMAAPAQAASAAAASDASGTAAAAVYKIPPGNAGAECTFDGRQLSHFHWLTPAEMVTPEAPS